MVRLTAPKGFKIRKVTILGNIPTGKTTFKLFLSKGRVPIPFPKTTVVKGTRFKSKGGGMNSKGQDFVVYE